MQRSLRNLSAATAVETGALRGPNLRPSNLRIGHQLKQIRDQKLQGSVSKDR